MLRSTPALQPRLPEPDGQSRQDHRGHRRRWRLPHQPGLSDLERQRTLARLVDLRPGDDLHITTPDAALVATLLAITADGKLIGQVIGGQIAVLDVPAGTLHVV